MRMLTQKLVIAACAVMVCLAAAAAEPAAEVAVVAETPVVTEQQLADTFVRLQKLNQGGLRAKDYQLSKALAFVEEARREYYLRNHSGIVFDFLESARVIAESLEKGIYIGVGNRRYAHSEPVAPELWRRIERLKSAPAFSCQQDLIARAEVDLLAAGNDQYLLGWRAAVARIRLAEQALETAEQVTAC